MHTDPLPATAARPRPALRPLTATIPSATLEATRLPHPAAPLEPPQPPQPPEAAGADELEGILRWFFGGSPPADDRDPPDAHSAAAPKPQPHRDLALA